VGALGLRYRTRLANDLKEDGKPLLRVFAGSLADGFEEWKSRFGQTVGTWVVQMPAPADRGDRSRSPGPRPGVRCLGVGLGLAGAGSAEGARGVAVSRSAGAASVCAGTAHGVTETVTAARCCQPPQPSVSLGSARAEGCCGLGDGLGKGLSLV